MDARTRIAVAATAGAVAAGCALAAAAPALAATVTVPVNCSSAPLGRQPVHVAPGDTLVFTGTPTCNIADIFDPDISALFVNANDIYGAPPYTFHVSPTAPEGTYAQSGYPPYAFGIGELYAAVTYFYLVIGPTGGAGADGAPPPADWIQAYSRAPQETCQEGWNPSWAQWPNNGAGGSVCTRTLHYDLETATWVVQ